MTFQSNNRAAPAAAIFAFDHELSEVVAIPESSGRLGHFELLVVVSELDRQSVAPGLLRQVSLDDLNPHAR